jgi:two-component system, chemotaxis family, sensor kinase CheA
VHLPLTLAIVPTLLVQVGESVFAIPLVMVSQSLRLSKKEIKTVGGKPVTLLRGSVLPLLHLSQTFDFGATASHKGYYYVVVVHSGKQKVGIVVDSLKGQEEVVVKSLSSLIGDLPGISSAAILGDGRVALIVDIPGLFKYAGIH